MTKVKLFVFFLEHNSAERGGNDVSTCMVVEKTGRRAHYL